MNLLRPIDRDLVVNGLRLHLLDWGGEGRPPLLLLHGFTGHAHAWDTLSIALQPHFHVLALDQRGHGDSDPADVYNPVVAFDDLDGRRRPARPRRRSRWSASRWAAATAMYFAVEAARARAASWSSSTSAPRSAPRRSAPSSGPPEPETWESIEQAAQHLLPRQPLPRHPLLPLGRLAQPPRSAPTAPSSGSGTRASRRAARPATSTGGRCCARSRVPTLVLRGEHSTVLDRDVAERMAKELPRRPLRRDPAGRPHPARGQPRGRPGRPPRLPRLLARYRSGYT